MKGKRQKRTVTAIVRAGILKNKSFGAIRAEVRASYPQSALAKAPTEEIARRIRWYRTKMKADNVKLPRVDVYSVRAQAVHVPSVGTPRRQQRSDVKRRRSA